MKSKVKPYPLAGISPLWFKTWFDSSFYHRLYAHRDEKEAVAFVDTLIAELDPSPYARMLDLGCGAGRHSKKLAEKGFYVAGLDLAASSIREAKRFESSRLAFAQHDMRTPFGNAYFDYIFNFFTSFGYFDNKSEDHRVMENISRALKPGGLVVMDYLNVFYSEQRMVANEEKEIDGIAYRISRWGDEQYFFKKIEIDNGQTEPYVFTERVAKLDLADFELLFHNHGLMLEKVRGDYALDKYDPETSPRLIMIARKRIP